MAKPVIGLIPLVDKERESYWMLPGYMKGIEQAGGLPVMLPLIDDEESLEQLADQFDGFLFTGGHDVSPALYKTEKSPKCGEPCDERDSMETKLLKKCLAKNKPVFGICRGIQITNAALGGTLFQDLPSEHPSDTCHAQKPPYDVPVHQVDLVENSPLQCLLEKSSLRVNSYHHQAVKELSPKLKPMAYSTDGLVEAVWMPDAKFLWAVQWHPEFSHKTDADSRKIFKRFVEACK